MDCVRSISFIIPGNGTAPDVQVYAEEGPGGTLNFTVTVLASPGMTADLRGLFFDVADGGKLAGLSQSGSGGKVTDFDTVDVIDLGNGANMQGKASPFDVGLEFGTQGIGKDDIQTASFTLSNAAGDLTLDDIAQVEFGARLTSVGAPGGRREGSAKLTTIAPAAPDANDDSYSIFEDGQSGLGDPSKTTEGVVFEVLDNDTDADGDTLTITHVFGAMYGTVTIVDGDDADSDPGDAVLYTPNLDYAGPDSFTYCITDNNGGTDFAEVQVAVVAVADVPELSYEVFAGAAVNQIILRVTATQDDADSSEFIDRILLSVDGGLPAGTIVPGFANPGDEPDQIVQDFLITVPMDQDTSYTLDITAWSKETSNGDEESATDSLAIVYEYNSNDLSSSFFATDQSMWATGDQFTFLDNRFLGINESWNESGGGFIFGATTGSLKTGFQSTLTFEGGEIDAEIPFDITVETNYNKTTDVLVISSAAAVAASGGGFTTEGPEGTYKLDFIFEFFATLKAGLDFGELGSWDIIDISVGPWNVNENILDLDSDNLGFTLPLPAGFSINFAWPNIDTTSDSSHIYNSSDASNNFLELMLDIDSFVFALLGLPNPFDIGFDIGVASGSIELADLDIGLGLNFLQQFEVAASGLAGTITYENGSSEAFIFGNDITLTNASDHDEDNDGVVEFALALDPVATLNNSTDLGFNFLWNFDLLKLTGEYDVVFDSGSLNLGPLLDLGGTIPIGDVEVFNSTFALDFASQDFAFGA
jgi:hypothetical protein